MTKFKLYSKRTNNFKRAFLKTVAILPCSTITMSRPTRSTTKSSSIKRRPTSNKCSNKMCSPNLFSKTPPKPLSLKLLNNKKKLLQRPQLKFNNPKPNQSKK